MSLRLLEVSGYVLAGGRSSRMGQNKALLQLRGKPLIEHAVSKLRRICREVRILGTGEALGAFAPTVADPHPGCGPLGGIEAALTETNFDWSLILPVDVPFVPTALLRFWAGATVEHGKRMGTRLSYFTVEGRPQPALLMAHRALLPFVSEALRDGRYKLLPVLEKAAERLREAGHSSDGFTLGRTSWPAENAFETGWWSNPPGPSWSALTEAQQLAKSMWFANLNTQEDFERAAHQVAALDT